MFIYEVLCCGYQNIVLHISINIDAILFGVIQIYLKGGVGFMDVVKESVSRGKSPPPSLAMIFHLEDIRLIVHSYRER
jgi:hypothetical protein